MIPSTPDFKNLPLRNEGISQYVDCNVKILEVTLD